jgi:hypothetical protein
VEGCQEEQRGGRPKESGTLCPAYVKKGNISTSTQKFFERGGKTSPATAPAPSLAWPAATDRRALNALISGLVCLTCLHLGAPASFFFFEPGLSSAQEIKATQRPHACRTRERTFAFELRALLFFFALIAGPAINPVQGFST